MEIDITKLVTGAELINFSASVAELGKNAGKITWQNAMNEGVDSPLLTTPEQIQALRKHVRGFGAWEDTEIENWTPAECNALFLQMVAGDLREAGLDDCDFEQFDWQNYQAQSEAGQLAGSFYLGDDKRVYYSLGD